MQNKDEQLGEEGYYLKVKGYFEELILALINSDNARENLHFKYVSHEWIGSPGWYFWPKKRDGVYFLKLVNAVLLEGGIDTLIHVYYYPHPQEDVFRHYSFVEQVTRASYVFSSSKPGQSEACPCHSDHQHHDFADLQDGLGIPVPQVRNEINPWLYCLGELTCFWKKGQLINLGIEAQTRSQTWSCRSICENDMGKTILDRNEIDRDLPAWELIRAFCLEFLKDLRHIGIFCKSEEEFLSEDSSGMKNIRFNLNYEPRTHDGYEEKLAFKGGE